MTVKEAIDIIRESPLWNSLTIKEKTEAIAHAMEAVENRVDNMEETDDIYDSIGEIYSDAKFLSQSA